MTDTCHPSDRHRELERRLRRILDLPVAWQAQCVLLAAELALPVLHQWEAARGLSGSSDSFIDCFRRWQRGSASAAELKARAKPLEVALPDDLRQLEDPSAAMAGVALLDVKMIALDQCQDVHIDILHTSICYAAVAAVGARPSDVWIGWSTLDPAQLELLERWWANCLAAVPELQ